MTDPQPAQPVAPHPRYRLTGGPLDGEWVAPRTTDLGPTAHIDVLRIDLEPDGVRKADYRRRRGEANAIDYVFEGFVS